MRHLLTRLRSLSVQTLRNHTKQNDLIVQHFTRLLSSNRCYSSFQNSHYTYCTSNLRTPKVYPSRLRTMKIDSPEFHALFTPELVELIRIFDKYGYELRVAGGPVRDVLSGKIPNDIDLATTATPTEMKEMFELEKIRMINNKGESHGTITARINDKENYEVTTLRIDIRTDGRHAEVAFTKDWKLDSNRRDLTVNSMFLDFQGTVYDYFNGYEDLKNKRVRFVGHPADRIQEDYLRILRYFRFYGRITEKADQHEEETLKGIQENCAGLSGIAGERLWVEIKKILEGNYACSLSKVMISVGLGPYIGLPECPDIDEFEAACERTEGLETMAATRIAGLLTNVEQVYALHKRMKFSNDDLGTALFIVNYRNIEEGEDPLKCYQYLLCDVIAQEKKSSLKIIELLKYRGRTELLQNFQGWMMPKFPVNGRDLIERNVPKGPVFAKVLKEMRNRWKFSDFTKTTEELLSDTEELTKKFSS